MGTACFSYIASCDFHVLSSVILGCSLEKIPGEHLGVACFSCALRAYHISSSLSVFFLEPFLLNFLPKKVY